MLFISSKLCHVLSLPFNLYLKKNWGGSEDHRKIPWVGWNTICLRKENGGLGVMKLREFNLSLLGNWCWRGGWELVLKEGVEKGGWWASHSFLVWPVVRGCSPLSALWSFVWVSRGQVDLSSIDVLFRLGWTVWGMEVGEVVVGVGGGLGSRV